MCKNEKECNPSTKIEIDYRKLHISKNKASFYESNVYDKSSYDSAIWEIEKGCFEVHPSSLQSSFIEVGQNPLIFFTRGSWVIRVFSLGLMWDYGLS